MIPQPLYLSANDETLREAASIFESIQQPHFTEDKNNLDFVIESEMVN